MALHHNAPIMSFTGKYHFLSNFFPVAVPVDGAMFPTLEHAYQASKTNNFIQRCQIRLATTAAQAKRMGKLVVKRPDWDDIKRAVMLDLLRLKFKQPYFRKRLLETGARDIIEGNTWGDTYWGVCNGVGENHLGKLIMQVREELRGGD